MKEVDDTLGVTHTFGGALLGAAVGHLVGQPALGSFVGAMAALVPDVDEPESTIGRTLPGLSDLVNALAGHRGFTHTFAFCGVTGILALVLAVWLKQPAPWLWFVAACLGSASHVFLDALTVSGVRPLWPRSDKWSWKIRTGTISDLCIGLVEAILTITLLT